MPDASEPGSFARAFALAPEGDGVFRCQLDGFGGTTLGCAALAAGQDVSDLYLHSLHACFVRPVESEGASRLRVETVSQGRRFARRRVSIGAGGRIHFELMASFAARLDGPELGADEPLPAVPEPESLPSEREVARTEGWDWHEDLDHPIELRWCGRPWDVPGGGTASRYSAWVRPCVLPAEGAERAAGIAFLADFHSHWPVARKLGGPFEPQGFTSLDQSVWIHRDAPWDDWWLLTSWTAGAHGGRSLGHRTVHDRKGRLVASMAQEALIPGARPRS